jgi:hypothetical protein
VIRRRSSQKGKDVRRDADAPPPFFNFTDETPAEDGPLFNLEELHEKRILSWSPEPEEFFEDGSQPEEAPTRQEREELARAVYERPVVAERPQVSVDDLIDRTPQATVAPPLPLPERVITPPAARVVTRPPAPVAPAEPLREVAPPAPPMPASAPVEIEIEADEETALAMSVQDAPSEDAPVESAGQKRRGRPRGRPRRQVHFHVDPDEERLLMLAVERYGSQQKGLIAALESLQEADVLRDEIERLRAETARHRRLLDEAESLFNR